MKGIAYFLITLALLLPSLSFAYTCRHPNGFEFYSNVPCPPGSIEIKEPEAARTKPEGQKVPPSKEQPIMSAPSTLRFKAAWEEAKKALDELDSLRAATVAGIKMDDYTSMLTKVGITVVQFVEKRDPPELSRLRRYMLEAFDVYRAARTLWTRQDIKYGVVYEFDPEVKEILNRYPVLYRARHRDASGMFVVSPALSLLWGEAQEKVKDARRELESFVR